MNEKTLRTLEFPKIVEKLIKHATSSLGVEKIQQLQPFSSYSDVVQALQETDEASVVLRLRGYVPLEGIFPIYPHIKRAKIGGMLNPVELVEVASTIYVGRQMKRFIEDLLEENEVSLPILYEKVQQIDPLSELEKQIKHAIDDHGEILDSASPTLRSIRQQIQQVENAVREKLENIIRSRNAQKMLSDAIITIRNDRFVIPVKQEYRAHYGGIVHDQSSSGQTLFIEPQVIVDLNNHLRELKLKESVEIERILLELSAQIGEHAEELTVMTDVLAELDFIFAKAKFAKELKATKPIMNEDGAIHIKQAWHPLLPMDEAVANDIILGNEYTTMVITGPNTGGKTITLKTVGLLTLMAQAGLFIPASEGSEIKVFKKVFADIGDEQSIEQSLSTFSSHMVNIVDILKQVDPESLVLFDELGAGTDPQEGAALAISILDEVFQRGAHVIATTHYPELKAYGYNRPKVINASVEFDVETLRPTYRLLIGVPGRSNAFEISKRLGLSEHVIENAKKLISTETNEVENMIVSLEKSRQQAEEEYEEIHEILKSAEKLHRELTEKMNEYYAQKDNLIKRAEEKAKEIVEKAKREAEEIIKELREMRLKGVNQLKEHELIAARTRLDAAIPQTHQSKDHTDLNEKPQNLQPGDEVMVTSFGQKGILIDRVNDHEWNVQIGIMKMKVDESQLKLIKSEKKQEVQPIATIKGKDYHVSLELDIRGERLEDALLKVEKYIDDALLANYPRVSIIHGKGTGALRAGITEYLKQHRAIKRIRLGEAGEGGSGVTIVEFK